MRSSRCDSKQMGSNPLIDQFTGDEHRAFSVCSIWKSRPQRARAQAAPIEAHRYTPHKRMQ